MDFDQAIAAHSAWKKKLKSYLANPDGSLHPDDIARDDQCVLGQWIRDDAPLYSQFPEFATLKTSHSRLHEVAGQLVRRSQVDSSALDETQPGANSEFTAATSAVVLSLVAMKKRTAK